jgi:hypothetical protein
MMTLAKTHTPSPASDLARGANGTSN